MKICPACDGDGELVTSHRFTCYECHGKGSVDDTKYEAVLSRERQIQRELDAYVRASEYRAMG